MSIEIRHLDDDASWNDLLADAAAATAFHRAEAIDVLAAESGCVPHRLVGYKGEEAIGLFPLFTKQYGPVTAAFSPPPHLKIPYLGPVLRNANCAKRRLQERRHSRFVDACEQWLAEEYDPKYSTIVSTPGYVDVRPFIWNDYEATPRYTYVVDLDRDRDDILASFSRNARRNVTTDHDVEYELSEGGPAAIADILPAVAARHAQQGRQYPIDAEFVTRLYEALPSGMVRPLVCRVGDEFAGGHVVLEYGDTAMLWVSAAERDVDLPVGDLLVWWYIEQNLDSPVGAYDLAGANLRRLSQYKAKFAPTLQQYYRVQKCTWGMNAAVKLYGRIQQ